MRVLVPLKCLKDGYVLPGLADLGQQAGKERQRRALPRNGGPVDVGHAPHVILLQVALRIPRKGHHHLQGQARRSDTGSAQLLSC